MLMEPYVQLVGSSYSNYVYTLVLTVILFWICCRLGGTPIESPGEFYRLDSLPNAQQTVSNSEGNENM